MNYKAYTSTLNLETSYVSFSILFRSFVFKTFSLKKYCGVLTEQIFTAASFFDPQRSCNIFWSNSMEKFPSMSENNVIKNIRRF